MRMICSEEVLLCYTCAVFAFQKRKDYSALRSKFNEPLSQIHESSFQNRKLIMQIIQESLQIFFFFFTRKKFQNKQHLNAETCFKFKMRIVLAVFSIYLIKQVLNKSYKRKVYAIKQHTNICVSRPFFRLYEFFVCHENLNK